MVQFTVTARGGQPRRKFSRGLGYAVSLVAVLGGAGCFIRARPSFAPDATFAAYRDDEGLRIDLMEGGGRGQVEDADCGIFCSGPQLVLQSGSSTDAAFWVHATKTVVRRDTDAASPRLGEIEASWQNAAVRYSLKPEGGAVFETGPFERTDGGFAPLALGQPIDLSIELSGVFMAKIVDDSGAPGGWLRVRISPRELPTRVYDGVLPSSVNGALAAATVARIDAVIDSTVRRSMSPYLGN